MSLWGSHSPSRGERDAGSEGTLGEGRDLPWERGRGVGGQEMEEIGSF